MAASMRFAVTLVSRRINSVKFQGSSFHTANISRQSTLAHVEDSEEVVYPPIKPKYPPGQWGKISPKHAWRIQDQADELLKIPNVKMRLEKIAGPYDGKMPFLFGMKLIDPMPGTLDFKQYATKTHVVDGLPDIYAKNADIENSVKGLRPLFVDAIQHQADQYNFLSEQNKIQMPVRRFFGTRLMGRLLSLCHAGLAATVPHLHRSQLDEDVRVETFWKRGGYDDEYMLKGANFCGILTYQIKHRVSCQIRTEMPLPEVCTFLVLFFNKYMIYF